MFKQTLLFSISFLVILSLLAQNADRKKLRIYGLEGVTIEHNSFISDSLLALSEKNIILQQLYELSYLAASFDSLKVTLEEIELYFTKGEEYKWLHLKAGNLPPNIISRVDIQNRIFYNQTFNKHQLTELYKRAIQHFENNGYPFASIGMDSIEINERQAISAVLTLDKGPFYQFDSIEVVGDIGVSERYILNSLSLKLGKPYVESKFKNITSRIQEIPFLEEEKIHEVQFFEKSVKLILYLKKKKASRFDGIVGLMTNEADGSISVTGDVNLQLINAFNRGEQLSLSWEKMRENSQELTIDFKLPYLFSSPFGLDYQFDLYKEDTTFLDLKNKIGVNYIFSGEESIIFFVANRQSSLLSKNQYLNSATTQLPPFADISTTQFGIRYLLQRLDYSYNPQRGFRLQPTFAVGQKKAKKILALEEQYPNIYSGFKENSNQYDGEVLLNLYIPIGKRSTIMLANQSASTYADVLFTNELFRIGGLKTLRGFDERSIRASTYSIFTLEYRFLLDRNSYLSVFSDGGFYEAKHKDGYVKDIPYGIGAGINFETGVGIFSFNYAVGKQFDNPIEIRSAKIHFGYTSIF